MSMFKKILLKASGLSIKNEYHNGTIVKYVDLHNDNQMSALLKLNLINPMQDIQMLETHDGKNYYRAYLGLNNSKRQLLGL